MVDTTRLSGIQKASGKKVIPGGGKKGTGKTGTSTKTVAKPKPQTVNTTNLKGISAATGTTSQTGKKVASVVKEQSQPKKKAKPIPLSTFSKGAGKQSGSVNTNTIEGIRKASQTGELGVRSSGKNGQSSASANLRVAEQKVVGLGGQSSSSTNLRMAESKPAQKYGDENRSSLKPTTSTTKPVAKPVTTTATPAPKPTPSVPAKTTSSGVSTTASGSSSSTGTPIKIATSNLFVLNEPEQEIEQMANLIIQDIGGIELLSYSRNDLIAEQEINYQPIKNIADTSLQYSPLNILAVQDVDLDYFNKFPISLERHLPRFGNGTNGEYVYINTNNEIVVEAVNLLPGEYIEIQFLSFGSTVSDTIYT